MGTDPGDAGDKKPAQNWQRGTHTRDRDYQEHEASHKGNEIVSEEIAEKMIIDNGIEGFEKDKEQRKDNPVDADNQFQNTIESYKFQRVFHAIYGLGSNIATKP